ncbi:MAG: VOC family protein [Alphaproteobacteria bacterium]|nr:VOC family protein [Alphaproteobacteria bacterium]
MTVSVEALDHLVINVKDVEVAAAWYERVLGMKRVVSEPRPGRTVTSMHFGRQKINLRPHWATQKQWFTGNAIAPGSDDLCFLTSATPQQVADHFRSCGVAIEAEPSERLGAMGVIVSVYCRDPDGNLIEVSSYK